jgi:hypothetical protein
MATETRSPNGCSSPFARSPCVRGPGAGDRKSPALILISGSHELTAVHCDIRALSDPFRERPPLLRSFSDNATFLDLAFMLQSARVSGAASAARSRRVGEPGPGRGESSDWACGRGCGQSNADANLLSHKGDFSTPIFLTCGRSSQTGLL